MANQSWTGIPEPGAAQVLTMPTVEELADGSSKSSSMKTKMPCLTGS
jgi:hypothetical protein